MLQSNDQKVIHNANLTDSLTYSTLTMVGATGSGNSGPDTPVPGNHKTPGEQDKKSMEGEKSGDDRIHHAVSEDGTRIA